MKKTFVFVRKNSSDFLKKVAEGCFGESKIVTYSDFKGLLR